MTSLVKKTLISSKGIQHDWHGLGWYNHARKMIIVSNFWESKIVKLDDFMKCETMRDLEQCSYAKWADLGNKWCKVSEHDKYLKGETFKLLGEK